MLVKYKAMVINVRNRGDQINGRKLEDFIKIYWQALCRTPKRDNPAWENNDGSKDGPFNNSVGADLYMLSFSRSPQTPITRRIEVPKNKKGLFIPVMSVIVSACETSEPLVDTAAKDQRSILPPGSSLELDKTSLPSLEEYFFPPFNVGEVKFPNPADAIFNINSSGPCDARAAGRYVWTHPLSPGDYKVRFKGVLRCRTPPPPRCIDDDYSEDITYEIHVPP